MSTNAKLQPEKLAISVAATASQSSKKMTALVATAKQHGNVCRSANIEATRGGRILTLIYLAHYNITIII